MGLRLFGSSSVCDREYQKVEIIGNPDPRRFEILKIESIGKFIIVQIRYPDSINYEGNKILVYKNITELELRNHNIIDPHFCEDADGLSPIARFKPTEEGYLMAKKLCEVSKEY